MWEGGGGQDGVEWGGGEWDNCNSIINKYIFKKCNLKKEKIKYNAFNYSYGLLELVGDKE